MSQSKRKNARGTSHSTTKAPESTQSTGRKKAKTHGKKKARARPSSSSNKRTFKGRVSMNARPLGRSDGVKRGEGVWMEKGMNTVKGNMQEIACDVVSIYLLPLCLFYFKLTSSVMDGKSPSARSVRPELTR
jgi:hypothetical protein